MKRLAPFLLGWLMLLFSNLASAELTIEITKGNVEGAVGGEFLPRILELPLAVIDPDDVGRIPGIGDERIEITVAIEVSQSCDHAHASSKTLTGVLEAGPAIVEPDRVRCLTN